MRLWDGAALVGAGGSPVAPDPEFTVGATFPDASNVGLLPTARTAWTGLLSITGSSDIQNPLIIANRTFNGLVTIVSGAVSFLNCEFKGGPGTFNTGLVDCRAAGVLRVTAERCDFDPGASASYWLNAMIGHHITMRRCRVRRVVDMVGGYNTHTTRVDNVIEGNWLEWLVRYDVDADHTDGTHNDGYQGQSGLGHRIVGNRFDGRTFYADGSSVPAEPYLRAGQGVIIQQNVQIGGVYVPVGEVEVHQNWLTGWQTPIVLKTRTSGGTAWDAHATGNRLLDDDQRYYGTTLYGGLPGRPYIIRLGSQTTLNGASYPTDGSLNYAPGDDNAYAEAPEVIRAPLRGQPVPIRRDATGG